MKLQPEQLQQLLLPAHPPLPEPDAQVPQAAVLLLVCAADNPHTVLTLRSAHLPSHAGQISLPGGRVEAQDSSLEMTALREAWEETGLPQEQVRLLGRLPQVSVSSGTCITPVVGWTEDMPELQADPGEVELIIPCPLEVLLRRDAYCQETLIRKGVRRDFWVIYYQKHRIWGATASILRSLACLLQD